MTLYLSYRPKTIAELDNESAKRILTTIAASKSRPHAFLFAGPKGIGKTSAARILAKIVNCEDPGEDGTPCSTCASCMAIDQGTSLDVIEMDAASNRGIDDIRALKEHIMLAPSQSQKKVYIIDEAHMLTTEASNALLKTLEEPPAHVVFIFATTDPQKLPPTILSRLTTVTFVKASMEELTHQLTRIVTKEKIAIESAALTLLAERADGSFRDAAKLLEMLALQNEKITVSAVNALGTSSDTVEKLAKAIEARNAKSCIEYIEAATENGQSVRDLTKELIKVFKAALMANITGEGGTLSAGELIALIESLSGAYTKALTYPLPETALEIAVIEWCKGKEPPRPKVSTLPQKPIEKPDPLPPVIEEEPKKKLQTVSHADPELWTKIVMSVRDRNTTLDALFRAALLVECSQTALTIGVYYRFHKEKLETTAVRSAFDVILSELFPNPVAVEYVLLDPPQPTLRPAANIQPLTPQAPPDILHAAKEIFG